MRSMTDQQRREHTSSRVVGIIAYLDELVDDLDVELGPKDRGAVRVLAADARRSLVDLNHQLLRIPPSQR